MGDRFLVTPTRGTAGKGKVFWLAPREGGGRITQQILYGEVPPQGPPQGPPPYPFIYHF